HAEEWGATVRIVPSPEGAVIGVDGVYYNRPVTLIWPIGTKHTLTAVSGGEGVFNTQFGLDHWEANGVIIPGGTINVTADPAIREIKAVFTTAYALTLAFFDCPECNTDFCVRARKEQNPPPTQCQSPGTVYVDGTPVFADQKVFVNANSTIRLTAIPNAGYVFSGWVPDENQVITGFINVVTMNKPQVARARFVYGRRVNLTTDPPELDLLADRSKVSTPAALDWGIYTTHTVGPVTPQQDKNGKWWAFQSWSDGGAQIHGYAVDQSTTPATLTAKFVPVAVTQVSSLPPGLAVKVDGRDNWASFNFPWGTGETHKVEAPAELTDEQGRSWRFRSWSDGGAASHEITVGEGDARIIATYDQL